MESLAGHRLSVALRWLRKTHELSQREIGTKLGWSQTQVKKLENMQTPNVGVTAIEDVCRRFKLPWGYFHAPGAPDMDPGQYMAMQPVEAQMEALRVQLEQRIEERVDAAVKAQREKRDPPSAPRRKLVNG